MSWRLAGPVKIVDRCRAQRFLNPAHNEIARLGVVLKIDLVRRNNQHRAAIPAPDPRVIQRVQLAEVVRRDLAFIVPPAKLNAV